MKVLDSAPFSAVDRLKVLLLYHQCVFGEAHTDLVWKAAGHNVHLEGDCVHKTLSPGQTVFICNVTETVQQHVLLDSTINNLVHSLAVMSPVLDTNNMHLQESLLDFSGFGTKSKKGSSQWFS